MTAQTTVELMQKSCRPCEGGVPKLSLEEAREQTAQLDGWELDEGGGRIRKRWQAKNFVAAIDFFNRIADLAEQEQHHPDLHLEGYRHVTVELTTHAIEGLSENDFIVAAKIDALPIDLR